jgi:hypothetical protein
METSLFLRFRCLLVQDKLKWNEDYSHKLGAAWMRILWLFWLAMDIACYHVWIYLLLPKGDTETQDTDFTKLLALIMGRQLYTYLPPLSGADEVSGYQWQLVATMHLILCGWQLQGYGCTHSSCVCFSLAGTDTQWCSKCFCGVFSAMLLRF